MLDELLAGFPPGVQQQAREQINELIAEAHEEGFALSTQRIEELEFDKFVYRQIVENIQPLLQSIVSRSKILILRKTNAGMILDNDAAEIVRDLGAGYHIMGIIIEDNTDDLTRG